MSDDGAEGEAIEQKVELVSENKYNNN